jgi:glycosyltransferase involved in cell wall biosynthesis
MESFNKLYIKLLEDNYLDDFGIVKEELKYNITIPTFHIKNSKFVGKPEDKFETLLFLPPNPQRKAEGGLRTKGFFKFSYKKVRNKENVIWYICNLKGEPLFAAPENLQNKINHFISQNSSLIFLPLITIITVVLNGVSTLEDTIKSVIHQTYPNIEYIIIDGGSTDGTIDIIKKYENYLDYWVSEPDRGIYNAMNKGIKLANGYYINFMNSGDYFVDNNTINEIFKKIDIRYCDIIYGNTLLSHEKQFFRCIPKSLKKLTKGMVFIHQSSFSKRELFLEELYDENFMLSADYKWFMIMYFSRKKNFCYKDIYISVFDGDNGIGSKKIFQASFENFKIRLKILGIKSSFINIMEFIITIIRYLIRLSMPIKIRQKIRRIRFGIPVAWNR